MSVAQVRTAIATILAGIPDIGRVHSYQRYANSLTDLKALYYSEEHGQIRGWYVTRSKTSETDQVMVRTVETTHWMIHGVIAFSDANQSELIADSLIEQIRDTFIANDDLNETVSQCSVPKPGGGSREAGIQLRDFGPVMFGGVLCHGIKLELITIRYLTRTP